MWRKIIWMLSSGLTLLPVWAGTLTTYFTPVGVPPGYPVSGIETAEGRRFYLSDRAREASALVVFVPGSGCDGAYRRLASGQTFATIDSMALPAPSDVQLLMLDPPGVPRQFATEQPGSALGCPQAHLRQSSFEARLRHYRLTLDDYLASREKPPARIQFIGASEGTEYALALAAYYPQTQMVTVIAGFGISQLNDLLHDTVAGLSQADAVAAARALQAFRQQWQAIENDPTSLARVYRGHPYWRWSTTARQSPAQLALRLPYKVQLYIVHGGQDDQSLLSNYLAGLSELIVAGRPFATRLIPCGDHQLVCPADHGEVRQLEGVIRQAVQWFGQRQPPVDAAIVHWDARVVAPE